MPSNIGGLAMASNNTVPKDLGLIQLKRYADDLLARPAQAHLDIDALEPQLQPLGKSLEALGYALGHNAASNGPQSNQSDPVDTLTGLLRASDFLRVARDKVAAEPHRQWAVASIDLGHLRLFNEWHGTRTGDELLAQIGEAMRSFHTRHGGIAGYWGQDDFSALLPSDDATVKELFAAVSDAVARHDDSIGFLPAMGVYPLAQNETVGINQYDRAAFTARQAKHSLDERVLYFCPADYHKAQEENNILLDFQQAMAHGDVSFHLQAQAETSTGRIAGAEALARWRTAGGYLSPAAFIPVLEKTGFVTALDKEVWRQVIQWVAESLAKNKPVVPVSINVSRADVEGIDVAAHLLDLIDSHGVPHDMVRIEITESAYTEDTELVTALVDRLHDAGFLVLMDDFGSGQSSLSMLKTVDVDAIKLDGGFMSHNKDVKGTSIVESVINLATSLSIPVVAEGVETDEQLQMLKNLGCSYVQGFRFARPLPADEFANMLAERDC